MSKTRLAAVRGMNDLLPSDAPLWEWFEAKVMELAGRSAVTLLCGRYEGVDERLLRRRVQEELSLGDYVVTGARRGRGRAIQIGTCGFNAAFASLLPDEREFLQTRFNCCGETCACVRRAPVECFVDPCDVASCPDGTCTSNYCGGCRAEFATPDGANVCQPCETDEDCPLLGQSCDPEGTCRLG